MSSVAVHHGDSREVLKTLADCSVDSCVTDPPYALVSIGRRFGQPGAADLKKASRPKGEQDPYVRASAGFMGQKWDTGDTAHDPDFWREVYRVLKPGAHVVAFAGTRTYHRLACAIEDAGFEIRDMVAWLYGSGFPKSLNVAKAIQRRRVEDAEPVRAVCRRVRAAMQESGFAARDLTGFFGDCHPRLIDHWAARDSDSQPALPTWDQWRVLRGVLPGLADLDAEVARLNDRKGEAGEAWTGADVVGEHDGPTPGLVGRRFSDRDRSIRAASAEAADWAGWGTALKPALEPIVLARKPLAGTVAANVLAHGCGALNIDGCRTDFASDADRETAHANALGPVERAKTSKQIFDGGRASAGFADTHSPKGRWPANICHDGSDEVLVAFPEAPGQQRALTGDERSPRTVGVYGEFGRDGCTDPRGDSGSAARFFYCAKADALDRLGSKHPTVKPVALMRWLCRLVTPPGGLILDPFAGTGTTGLAAIGEGFHAILVEREADYVADIERRLAWARGEGPQTSELLRNRGARPDEDPDSLFAKVSA